MPRGAKEPEGSTANLPPMQEIEQAEENIGVDIDAVFGMGDDDDDNGSPPEGAGASPSPADAGAGAGGDEGSPSAPVTPPPSGNADPAQTATSGDGQPSAPPAQQPAEAGQPPAPAAVPPQVAPVDAAALRLQSLEAQVQGLQAELARARANPPATGEQQPGREGAGGGSGQADDLPRYNLNLPQQVAAALTSGDDQQTLAGITHMMNSLATIVHHNVRLEMRSVIGSLMQSAREQDTQTQTASAMEQAREDYYKAFPQHKDPALLPIIQSEVTAMAAEFPGLGWSDQYRNALGARVEARLAVFRGQALVTNGGGQPPAAPAASIPGGARPNAAPGSGELEGSDLIVDTFS